MNEQNDSYEDIFCMRMNELEEEDANRTIKQLLEEWTKID